MSDLTKAYALFNSLTKRYSYFKITAVGVEDNVVVVSINLDTNTVDSHKLHLVVSLDTDENILSMYARHIFTIDPDKVEIARSVVSEIQYQIFQGNTICNLVFGGRNAENNYCDFFVYTNTRFIGHFNSADRPVAETVSECEELLALFIDGYSTINNELVRRLPVKIDVESRRQRMI